MFSLVQFVANRLCEHESIPCAVVSGMWSTGHSFKTSVVLTPCMDWGPCSFHASFGYRWTKRPYWSPIVTTQMLPVHRWIPMTKVEAAACICSWSPRCSIGQSWDKRWRHRLTATDLLPSFVFFPLWTAKIQCKLANHCLRKAFFLGFTGR